ncbi:uncharacterized protein LOC112545077 isoform X1 [Pelodiscus sinensis]|uniref:uncharacterized protein LOC112545077 isoform X1 n=1 Tax=Pelodiscus sinensis TaxID=13735 RepID=UPI003F6C94E6
MEPELALHLLVQFMDLLLQACQQWLEAAWFHLVHVIPLPLRLATLRAMEQVRWRPGTGMPRRIWCLDTSSDWWDRIVLESWGDQQWTQNFRMRRDTFLELCEWLAPALHRRDTRMRPAIPLQKRVAIALWKLSTPDSYRSVGNQFGMGRSTVGAVLMQVRRSSATEPGGRGLRGGDGPPQGKRGDGGGRRQKCPAPEGPVSPGRTAHRLGELLLGVGRGALPGHEHSQPPGRPTDSRFAVSLCRWSRPSTGCCSAEWSTSPTRTPSSGCSAPSASPTAGGAIDGMHIPIRAPEHQASQYVNRKGYFYVLLQATCDHRGQFTDINVGWSGKAHDARVYRNSSVCQRLHAGTFFPNRHIRVGDVDMPVCLVGDAAYPLQPWLKKPYMGHLNPSRQTFNARLTRARIVIEGAFG